MSSRDVGARLFFPTSRPLNKGQASVFQVKICSAPVDAVAHKTCGPDKGRDQVSQWQEQNIAKKLWVVH